MYARPNSAMRGGAIDSAFPYVAPDRCCTLSGVLVFNALYTFTRNASLCPFVTPGNTFSKRRLMRLVLGRRSAPMGSTFRRIDGIGCPGAANDTCRAHAVLLRFS